MRRLNCISANCCGIIFILTSLVTNAQPLNKMVVINSETGLSQNSVYSICEDSEGFLWIGTGDGLNRYDGREFVIYKNSSQQSVRRLKGFTINNQMAEDNLHHLWLSTERNLVQFNQTTQTFTEIVPLINNVRSPGNKIISSLDTAQNTIWFITPAEYLYSYNYVKNFFKKFNLPEEKSGNKSFVNPQSVDDKRGNIWITSSDGIYSFNKNEGSWKSYFKGVGFDKICIGSDGKLWAMNGNTVFLIDSNRNLKRLKNHFSKSGIYISIAADNNGKIWCGTIDGKLYYASAHDKEMRFAGDISKMSGSQNILELRCLYIDKSNLLWIGTEGGGIIKFDLHPPTFKIFPTGESGFTANSLYIKSVFCDSDGKVWLGTFKKGIFLLDPKTSVAVPLNLPHNKKFHKLGDVVYAITKDKQGIYWIGYDGCLIACNKEKQQYFFHPMPTSAYNRTPLINQVSVEDSFLMVAATSGLYKVYTTDFGKNVQFKQILRQGIMESLRTSDGSLWASSMYYGLLKVNSSEIEDKFSNQFADNGFRCLVEDKTHKILWAASQMGLLAYHLPTGKYKFYDKRNGLLNEYIYAIILSGNELWVSTNKGLARGFISYKKGAPLPDVSFKGYTKEDGLQSNEFNTGAYASASNGYLFFGGIHGVNWFLPQNVSANLNKPKVAITDLKINDSSYGKKIAPGFLKTLTTTYDNNTITIKFIGLEFSNPDRILYKFKMEGLEKKWSTEQNTRQVRYANIPPGTYTFRLMAANSDNILSDEALLAITILPPFYSTWWFRLLMAAVILFLIIFITRKISQYKLKKKIRLLEKQKVLEDERQRISKEMHDDLGAGLTQISLMSEAAKRRSKTGVFPAGELNDISITSKQLIENVSEIIWAMNPEFDSLSGMISYLREQTTKLLDYWGKEYEIQLPEDYPDIDILNSKRKNILMLVKEALNNAIKHSGASFISVKMMIDNDQLEIEVKDNGCGFDVNKISSGHGMKNYVFRAGLLQGCSKITSSDAGTEVSFSIPLKG
jgi:signal transduction histidine kinase/ligand-binding sensor domain-containing protein